MLTFDEVYETIPGQGWLTNGEARLLWDSARESDGGILEVGSYFGRSTVLLASLGRPVLAVDPFDGFDSDKSGDEVHAELIRNLESRRIRNVEVFRCRIEDWKPWPVGFAYLDGDHTFRGTVNQLEAARKAGAETVCVHDYADEGGGLAVKRALTSLGMTVLERVERMVRCRYEPHHPG